MYTWIVSHHPTEPDAEPRIVVLVELDDGIRFVANLHGRRCPTTVENGMEVAVSIEPSTTSCSRSSGRSRMVGA